MPRQLTGVRCDTFLERAQHIGRRAEESVRRNQAADPAVRTLEIVIVDEVTDPRLSVRQVHEHRRLHALAP
jgi:hypoxanthine phosphoribosyltransferase